MLHGVLDDLGNLLLQEVYFLDFGRGFLHDEQGVIADLAEIAVEFLEEHPGFIEEFRIFVDLQEFDLTHPWASMGFCSIFAMAWSMLFEMGK